ncbi:hypothetical protein Tco_1219565 [Tanacetum coccineum]
MCTYLKNMEGYKLKDLKSKGFDSIQEMFDRAFKRLDYTESSIVVQKVDDDKETTKLKQCMEIIPDEEEVTIDAIPLAVKSPRIVDWKIHKEGKKSYYQIIRADGKSQMYRIFSQMIKSFDREDLEDLYKLVKARYGSTRPVESMDYLLWNDMKIMFEPHVEDEVWKLQNGYKVLEWKLYDSCGVHFLRMQSMQIYMLVEKKYPLTPPTLSMMLEKKLQIDYEITYTSVYTDSKPGRVFWGADEELSDGGYVVDSDLDKDPKEDPKEDHTDYPVDGGDGDDEPLDDNDDDDDTYDEDEEPFEDEDDDEEEEEHLALADSSAVLVVHPFPLAGDTEAFEIDESAPTSRSPQTKVPFAQTRLRRARKMVRLEEYTLTIW